MASVGFGSTAVAPASSRTRPPRRSVFAASATARGGKAAANEEKSLGDFITGFIFKENQLLETDPLLNKVDDDEALAPRSSIPRAKTTTRAAVKKGDDNGGGFSLGGLFAKKD
jgi:hypothetical protein